MLEKILQQFKTEDREGLFTGEQHPNIYDAVAAISREDDVKEIEKTIKHYFEQVLQISPHNSKIYYEAQRMIEVCERVFCKDGSIGIQSEESRNASRDMNDEIADFYLESLKHFASSVDEEILYQHIMYLEDKRQ